jgi:hypothetical protein
MCDSALLDPLRSALRKDPFFSEDFVVGRSDFAFFADSGLVIAAFFCGGGGSEPLIDEAELIGFLERF